MQFDIFSWTKHLFKSVTEQQSQPEELEHFVGLQSLEDRTLFSTVLVDADPGYMDDTQPTQVIYVQEAMQAHDLDPDDHDDPDDRDGHDHDHDHDDQDEADGHHDDHDGHYDDDADGHHDDHDGHYDHHHDEADDHHDDHNDHDDHDDDHDHSHDDEADGHHHHHDEDDEDCDDHDGHAHHDHHDGHHDHGENCGCEACTGGFAHGTPSRGEAVDHEGAVNHGGAINPDQDYSNYMLVDDLPEYESLPGSTNVIYLNFVGGSVSDTAWNNSRGVDTWETKAYDLDGDWYTFNATEQEAIYNTWQMVAEDFAPFNVNVTTKAPASYTRTTAVAHITESTDMNGVSLPHYGWAGIAYVGVFGSLSFSYYSPAWFVASSNAASLASGISHEIGHNLGLSHDGDNGNTYYYGHNLSSSNTNDWTAIMGSGNAHISQWSKGEYRNASNTTQDDLAVLAGKLGYRADDHGDDAGTATALSTEHGGYFSQTGLIENTDDPDVFSFYAYAGDLSVQLTPEVYFADTYWGTNLDSKLELRDSNWNLLASDDPAHGVTPAIDYTITSEGTYYLSVIPVGQANPMSAPTTGYTSYGSLGQYEISGTYAQQQGAYAPLITEQPASQNINENTELTLSVQAHGSSALSYQWYLEGQLINSATGSSYTVDQASVSDAGTYTVVVSNSEGSQTSTAAVVTVVDLSDFNVTVNLGNTPTLTIQNPNSIAMSLTLPGDSSLDVLSDYSGNVIATLDASAFNQTIAAGGSLVIPITMVTAGLDDDVYESTVTFHTSNPVQSELDVTFSYTHGNPPVRASTMTYAYYETSNLSVLPDFSTMTPVRTGSIDNVDITQRDRDYNFAFVFTAQIEINQAGEYTFYTTSDDGSKLFINGTQVVNNDGLHAYRQRSGTITLTEGYHDIEIQYFERGGDESLEVSWAGPGFGQAVIADRYFEVVVEEADTPPVITSSADAYVNENVSSDTVVHTVTATDDSSITYSIAGGWDYGHFNIDSVTGEITFKVSPDYESPVDYNSNNIYAFNVKAHDGTQFSTQLVKIHVADLLEPPVFTSPAEVFVDENVATSETVYTVQATGNGTMTYSIAGGWDHDRFNINSNTGEITFKQSPDFENAHDFNTNNVYAFNVKAHDGTTFTTMLIKIHVEDYVEVAASPIFLSPAEVYVNENVLTSSAVYTVDAMGDGSMTYSIAGGWDYEFFDIDSETGEITFKDSPDYESPLDFNTNNIYAFNVKAHNGRTFTTQLIKIHVQNVVESPPVITSPQNVYVNENISTSTPVYTITANGESSLTYHLAGGWDYEFFNINSSTGEITFISSPDFENPLDDNANNIYAFNIKAHDGTSFTTVLIKIHVLNVVA